MQHAIKMCYQVYFCYSGIKTKNGLDLLIWTKVYSFLLSHCSSFTLHFNTDFYKKNLSVGPSMQEVLHIYTTQNLLRISFLTLHISALLQTIHLYKDLIIEYLSYRFVMYSLH